MVSMVRRQTYIYRLVHAIVAVCLLWAVATFIYEWVERDARRCQSSPPG